MPPGCVAPSLPSALATALQSGSAAKAGAVSAATTRAATRLTGRDINSLLMVVVHFRDEAGHRFAAGIRPCSVELLGDFFHLCSFHQGNVGDRLAAFEPGLDLDRAIAAVR